jgi:hypothetical protein
LLMAWAGFHECRGARTAVDLRIDLQSAQC